MLHPNQFYVNEAWIAFQLNAAPVTTDLDGEFNCVSLMDAASCFMLSSTLIPATEEIAAHGTAYPSMTVKVIHGGQTSVVQTDSQGNWAISIKRIRGTQLILVFESISDNIIVVTKTYQVE